MFRHHPISLCIAFVLLAYVRGMAGREVLVAYILLSRPLL